MEDVRDLKALQLDALREVANIGAGHAATALSQMTNRTIMIAVPEVNVRPLEEVTDLVGAPDDGHRRRADAHDGRPHRTHAGGLPQGVGPNALRYTAPPRPGTHRGVRRDGAVGPQGSRQHPRERLHERAQRLHGHDAAALGAQPGGRPERGGAHHGLPQLRARPRLRLLRRDLVPGRGHREPLRGHFLLLPDMPSLRAIFDAIRLP